MLHGVEPRTELIDNARQTLSYYGVPTERASFVQSDILEYLQQGQQFDIVMCLGFFYHTIRHAELLDLIDRTGAHLVIIDTEVVPITGEAIITRNDDPRYIYDNPNNV